MLFYYQLLLLTLFDHKLLLLTLLYYQRKIVQEIQSPEAPLFMTPVEDLHDGYICVGYKNQFDLISDKSGDVRHFYQVPVSKVYYIHIHAVLIVYNMRIHVFLIVNNNCMHLKTSNVL